MNLNPYHHYYIKVQNKMVLLYFDSAASSLHFY